MNYTSALDHRSSCKQAGNGKVQKTTRQPSKNILCPLKSGQLTESYILLVFFRFFTVFQRNAKHLENPPQKTKNNNNKKKAPPQARTGDIVFFFGFLFCFDVFGFLEVFAGFWKKCEPPRENQQKQSNQDCVTCSGLGGVVFFLFSRGVLCFWETSQTYRVS